VRRYNCQVNTGRTFPNYPGMPGKGVSGYRGCA